MAGPPTEPATGWRSACERWHEELKAKSMRLAESLPFPMLISPDTLTIHETPEFVC